MQYKFFISQNHACTFAQFENFIFNANLLIIVDVSRACNPSSLYIMSEILLLNLVLGCGNIPKISFEISDDLFEDLKVHALQTESGCTDLIVEYIEQGLNNKKGCDNMSAVILDEDVVRKVNRMAELTDQTPKEVVNETLRDQLKDVENIPREIDYDKLWEMLDHDKPEGDDILDNLARLGEEGWD